MLELLFQGYNLRFLLSLVLAVASGILIGAERELRGKDAGVRTHSFVVVGSMIFSFISSLMVNDQARIAAQIITGVGFLGAGIIMKAQTGHVQNLTTAASIWYSAAIGMAFGFGFYFIGIVGALFALLIAWFPNVKRRGPKPKMYYNDGDSARIINM
jgi:putative Mg2+ transporter-C (MgtC) family protein